nr:hypothetical protein [uncultured Neptuniibacter sp.]
MREIINRFPQIAVHKIGVFMVDKGVDVVETTFVDFANRLSILAVHMHAGGKICTSNSWKSCVTRIKDLILPKSARVPVRKTMRFIIILSSI